VVALEKMGKPTVFLVTKYFEVDAKINAKSAGLPDINLVILPTAAVPPRKEIEELKLQHKVADEIISTFTRRISPSLESEELVEADLKFSGLSYPDVMDNMERYFLQHCWSDGFPLIPPTEEAVNKMLEATELPPNHVVGLIMPAGAKATIKKIAINAVMAGCLPQYMPVVIAAVEALTDPKFDLLGVQCTAGMVSPLLIVSGEKLIEQLNINDSFSTLGPGWRANSTIGRAIRLIMINIGHAWPGKPDMKAIGSPFKYVMCLGENEKGYENAWDPIRVAEGYKYDQPTISVFPAVTWQVEYMPPELASSNKVVELLGKQAKVKYDKEAVNWGMDNLVLLSATAFEPIRKEGRSRVEIQKMIYEVAQLPCFDFFRGKEPAVEVGAVGVPEWLVEKCKTDPDSFAPLLIKPESIKIVVCGAPGPAMVVYVSTWGWGPAHFVTKPVRLPKNWDNLLKKNMGWETPIVK